MVDFITSDGTRQWLTESTPTASVTTGDAAGVPILADFALLEDSLEELEYFTDLSTLDPTRPENRKRFLDKGLVLIPGIDTPVTQTFTVTEVAGADRSTNAYGMIRKAFQNRTGLTKKELFSDGSGRWATVHVVAAQENAPIGEDKVMTVSFAVGTVVEIPRPATPDGG